MLSSLLDFHADSKCLPVIANTYMDCTRQVNDHILIEDTLTKVFTDDKCRRPITTSCLETDPGLARIKKCHIRAQRSDLVKDRWARARG
jgi:hypothetical protein